MLTNIRALLGKGDIHPLLKGARILIAQNCTKADFDRVVHALHGDVKDAWQENGSCFAAIVVNDRSYCLSFHEKTGALRLVEDDADNLPPREKGAETVSPLITQGRLLYYAHDCGMLYVIRLTDGRFVVIDGGKAEYEEPEYFLDLLNRQNVLEGVPEIAAWFITHAHDDHFDLFAQVCERFYDQVKIDALVYNWMSPERTLGNIVPIDAFDRAIALRSEIPVITPHTGMRFHFPGAVFSVLYTHEDLCPDPVINLNNSSTVMRMDICGQKVMWTGDCLQEAADWLCKNYDASVLKSDFLQVAHHGYSGGSDAFYRAVDAGVLLWPCPDYWYYTQGALPCNRYLAESPNIKALFMSGREETVIDPQAPVIPSSPYARYEQAKPGDVLLENDFSAGRVYDLAWSSVTGGATNYASAALSLTEKGLDMIAPEGQYSVLELMQPGMLPASYTLDMQIRAEKAEKAALFWNYDAPWTYDESQALDLDLPFGQDVRITLQVCCECGQAVFTQNGETRVIPFTPAPRKGLYLILRDASATMRSIRVLR